MMTNEKAIETLKIAKDEISDNYFLEFPADYTVAFDAAIEALNKQTPVDAKDQHVEDLWKCSSYNWATGYCPKCNIKISNTSRFCSCCGQRIKWSGNYDK